ncbi:M48 family metallopeptidase [Nannocystaceae bacterium ST9]
MTTDSTQPMFELTVGDLRIEVVRKAIKNLHVGVYPPDGRVRVAAPLALSDAAVRIAVVGRLAWIRHQQQSFVNQARESQREMVAGESHYFLGQRYRLDIIPTKGKSKVALRGRNTIELHVESELPIKERERVLQAWYREQLRVLVPALLAKWQPLLGVEAVSWGIKRMKTKWGSCNPEAGRIWLNLELAKKPHECIEYVVVHELAHFLVRHHDAAFQGLLDRHLPSWRATRDLLNATPLANASWAGPGFDQSS